MHDKAMLTTIYSCFSDWSDDSEWACVKGCSRCCTQNVTITALEGEVIIDGLHQEGRIDWLKAKLSGTLFPVRPQYSLNTMARACLAGKSLPDEPQPSVQHPCPFLEKSCCTIYPLRPFSCRSFLSKKRCTDNHPAVVDESHLAAATAVSQLLEHASQRQPWGNMLDLLSSQLNSSSADATHQHLLHAQPLPGFLLGPKVHDRVAPLIDTILSAQINNRSIEDILNGR